MDNHFIPKEVYEVILEKVPVCTVDVILLNPQKTKTLLFRRNNEPLKDSYFSIGGRLFKDETFVECAVRQAKKELGLEIKAEKLFFCGIQQENHPNSAFTGISYHTVNIFYGYILEEDNLVLSLDEQHSDSKWFDINDKSLESFMQGKLNQVLSHL